MVAFKGFFVLFPLIIVGLNVTGTANSEKCSGINLQAADEFYYLCKFYVKINYTYYEECMYDRGYNVKKVMTQCAKQLNFTGELDTFCGPDKTEVVMDRLCCGAQGLGKEQPDNSIIHTMTLARMCIDKTILHDGKNITDNADELGP